MGGSGGGGLAATTASYGSAGSGSESSSSRFASTGISLNAGGAGDPLHDASGLGLFGGLGGATDREMREHTGVSQRSGDHRRIQVDLGARLQDAERDLADQEDGWEFAGWGNSSSVSFFDTHESQGERGRRPGSDGEGGSQGGPDAETPLLPDSNWVAHKEEDKLNQFLATAIAGNDISSSAFYMVGIATFVAGKYAPISVALVITVLYFFRNIYGEVCTALPLNGGTYNALLNTTTKQLASVAAGLTLLSYLATAVVSATSAVSYLHSLVDDVSIVWISVAVLGLFAILNVIGLGESAGVALAIFVGHLLTLLALAIVVIIQLFAHPPEVPEAYKDDYGHYGPFQMLMYNWHEHDSAPDGTQGWFAQIFFGFSSALIGVSGFESSANYIEEQRQGVFVKTLRNMWAIVAFFNPLFALLSIMTLNLSEAGEVQNYILAAMPNKEHYNWMRIWIIVDAFIVLSGAVLTSYVGVVGLVKRMSLDKCLPQFLLMENRWRKTNHFIIFGFFILTSSLCILTDAKVQVLAGVYCIAFLSVMALFAMSDLLLKYKRKLASEVSASWLSVFVALAAVLAGAIGNIIHNVEYLVYFSYYFIGAMAVIFIMFTRVTMLKMAFFAVSKNLRPDSSLYGWIQRQVKTLRHQPVVFFTRTGQLATLNKAALYVRENEETDWLRIVHVYEEADDDFEDRMEANVAIIDQLYPKMRVDLVMVHGRFDPPTVHWLSEMLETPKNYMFITAPTVGQFPHDLGSFGGIRVVTH
jgi:amino acid transporter